MSLSSFNIPHSYCKAYSNSLTAYAEGVPDHIEGIGVHMEVEVGNIALGNFCLEIETARTEDAASHIAGSEIHKEDIAAHIAFVHNTQMSQQPK